MLDSIVNIIIASCLLVAVAAFVLIAGRKVLQMHQEKIYCVTDKNGIELMEKWAIGGIEQYVHIRGRQKDNPILLFLHGGPGWPHIGWYDAIQRPWEDFFTVIQWDQRQCGKSFLPMKKIGHTISHEQYISDAEEMVAAIRDRFKQDKIFLMGTSYGTYIGMHLIKRRPEWFYAYVSVGQVVNMMEHASTEHHLLKEFAEKNNHIDLVNALTAMEPYPNPNNPAKSCYQHSAFLMEEESRYGKSYPTGFFGLLSAVALEKWISPHYTLLDNVNRKFGRSHDASHPFASSFMQYDLPLEVGSQFEVPIVFFTGSHDMHVASVLSDRWFQQIEAPSKQQIWFEYSAHAAFQSEPGRFLLALVENVLPFSQPDPQTKQMVQ